MARPLRIEFSGAVYHITARGKEHRDIYVHDEDRIRFLCILDQSRYRHDWLCHAYCLMSNHYHLVLHVNRTLGESLSDDEVIKRWLTMFGGPVLVQRNQQGESMSCAELSTVKDIVGVWRERLCDISWFMRCLNEFIARRANKEDQCTGRFWEGRFKSQALLDEAALLTCMAYVDLNPIRAGLADSLEASDFTSIQRRLFEIARGKKRHAAQSQSPDSVLAAFEPHDVESTNPIPFNAQDYLDLVDWTGRHIAEGKHGFIAEEAPRILGVLGILLDEWLPTVTELQSRFEQVIGSPEQIRVLAKHQNKAWIRGIGPARRLYERAMAA